MTKSILAIMTMAVMATACGSGDHTDVAAAAPPPTEAAPAAPPASAAAVPEAPAPTVRSSDPRPRTPSRPVPARRASSAPAAAPTAPAVPEYRELTLPAGTMLSLELRSAVASDVSEVEDTVRATLRQAIAIDGVEVLPAGTELAGTVTEAVRAGRVKGRAKVAFAFTSLRFDGERIALRTDPIEHLSEATKGEDATKIGVGAGAGAVIGGLLGGGSGAAKGAAIGGAAGTGAVLATRGKEIRLEPGTDLSARLAAPLAIPVRVR